MTQEQEVDLFEEFEWVKIPEPTEPVTLIEFLSARFAEEWKEHGPRTYILKISDPEELANWKRRRNEIGARGGVFQHCKWQLEHNQPERVTRLATHMLFCLAEAYRDHPDYKKSYEKWRDDRAAQLARAT